MIFRLQNVYCKTILLITLFMVNGIGASIRFTNLECEILDKSFFTFPRCDLTVPARGKIVMNMYAKLHQAPVHEVNVNFALYKKMNGYRPFLYNINMDFCAFMANKKRYPVYKVLFDIYGHSTNVNHTCPYDHDLIMKDLLLKESDFKFLPVPGGSYLFSISVGAYNIWRGKIRTYLTFDWDFD